eukprot:1008097-Rhodomonas_salina.1
MARTIGLIFKIRNLLSHLRSTRQQQLATSSPIFPHRHSSLQIVFSLPTSCDFERSKASPAERKFSAMQEAPSSHEDVIPEEYVCPITQRIMFDPGQSLKHSDLGRYGASRFRPLVSRIGRNWGGTLVGQNYSCERGVGGLNGMEGQMNLFCNLKEGMRPCHSHSPCPR